MQLQFGHVTLRNFSTNPSYQYWRVKSIHKEVKIWKWAHSYIYVQNVFPIPYINAHFCMPKFSPLYWVGQVEAKAGVAFLDKNLRPLITTKISRLKQASKKEFSLNLKSNTVLFRLHICKFPIPITKNHLSIYWEIKQKFLIWIFSTPDLQQTFILFIYTENCIH